MFNQIKTGYSNSVIIIILILVVLFNSFISLTPVLDRGLDGDDVKVLTSYNIHKFENVSFLNNISLIWTKDITRLYSNQYIYIGLLKELFGFNFRTYELIGILLKIVATLSIYPLVLTLFKNKFLAFSSAFFYSIIPSSAGGLTFIITSIDYLGVIFMSFFGISYYKLITEGKGLFITSLLLLLTISFSYIRTVPLLTVIFLVESFLFLKSIYVNRISRNFFRPLVSNIKRILIFYVTIQLLFLNITSSADIDVNRVLFTFLNPFIHGDWYFLLRPFYFLGYSIVDNNIYQSFLGGLPLNSSWLPILGKLTFIYSLFTLFIVWLIKPKRGSLFFFCTILSSIIAATTVLIIAKHAESISSSVIARYNPIDLNASLFGTFYFVLGLSFFIEWYFRQKSNKLLLMLSLCILWVLLFGMYAWFTGVYIEASNPVSRYLVIPSIGICLFISIVLQLFFRQLQAQKRLYLKRVIIVLLAIFVAFMYIYDIIFTRNFFIKDNQYNRSLTELDKIRSNFILASTNIELKRPALIYVEVLKSQDGKKAYGYKFLDSSWNSILYDKKNELILGCRSIVHPDFSRLKKVVSKLNEEEIEFTYQASCLEVKDWGFLLGKIRSYSEKELVFKSDEFYAYLLREGNFYDIKQQVLDRIKKEGVIEN